MEAMQGGSDAELDVAHALARCPPTATVRGMFFSDLQRVAQRAGSTEVASRSYVPFVAYPMRDFMEAQVRAARAAYPRMTLRQGLRRLGRMAYPTMRDSLVGRVLFAIASDPGASFALAPRAYEVVSTHGRCELLSMTPGAARLRLVELYNFVDSYHVGIAEGVLDAHRVRGAVAVTVESDVTATLDISWRG